VRYVEGTFTPFPLAIHRTLGLVVGAIRFRERYCEWFGIYIPIRGGLRCNVLYFRDEDTRKVVVMTL
jgi:hypothetical protein